MKRIYHIFSKGEDAKDFVINIRDKILAVNRIARCVYRTGVGMIAFSVEDTHVHFIICSTLEEALAFMDLYSAFTKHHIAKRGTRSDADLHMDIYEVADRQYLKNLGAYVAVQATKDHQPLLWTDNPFSSAPLYFRTDKVIPIWRVDRYGSVKDPVPFKELTIRDRERILCSRDSLPADWLVCNDFILPSNYVDTVMFEDIYKTHNAYRVFCASISDKNDAVAGKMAEAHGINLNEDEMREACNNLCRDRFGTSDVRKLDVDRRLVLARMIRRKYHAPIPQIARRVHLHKDELIKYLQ